MTDGEGRCILCAARVTATITDCKKKMKAAAFQPLVFEDAQGLLLDQLNAIHGRAGQLPWFPLVH